MDNSSSPDAALLSLGSNAAKTGGHQTAKELEWCTAANGGFIELTLTHPETASWLRASSEKQKMHLLKIVHKAFAAVPITHHVQVKVAFEYSMRGQIHCHAYLFIDATLKLYPIGAISDITKEALSCYPKKYNRFYTNKICSTFCRYYSPQVTTQYRYLTDEERITKWVKYCDKLQ